LIIYSISIKRLVKDPWRNKNLKFYTLLCNFDDINQKGGVRRYLLAPQQPAVFYKGGVIEGE